MVYYLIIKMIQGENMANYSSRRETILKVLKATKTHPCAEYVYEECRKSIPNISLGTVYRNLATLEESGDVIKVATVCGRDRYDGDTSPHTHHICPQCGKVSDIDISEMLTNALTQEKDSHNYQDIQLNFYSLCDECRENNNITKIK